MEKLELRRKTLLKALSRFDYMQKKFLIAYENRNQFKPKMGPNEEEDHLGYRDALIQRFEFSYDLTWKFLKIYLFAKYTITVESPRKVFQECFQQGLINEKEVEQLLKMIEARNYTTHVYDEDLIQELTYKIIDYMAVVKQFITKLDLLSSESLPVKNLK